MSDNPPIQTVSDIAIRMRDEVDRYRGTRYHPVMQAQDYPEIRDFMEFTIENAESYDPLKPKLADILKEENSGIYQQLRAKVIRHGRIPRATSEGV